MNLVLGAAAHYGIDEVRNFVLSMKLYVNADIVLLLQNNPVSLRPWLAAYNVGTQDIATKILVPQGRYFDYLRFLSKHPGYDTIFLSDVRDVVAQGDIFTALTDDGLHVFEEDSGTLLGEDRPNSAWIKMCYGEEGLQRLKDQVIICSGTTYGDRISMLCYLKVMCDEFLDLQKHSPGLINEMPFDQGPHNFICRLGKLEEALKAVGRKLYVHANAGPVYTLGLTREPVTVDQAFVLNPDGTLPGIVHQYDRSREMKEIYAKLYADTTSST